MRIVPGDLDDPRVIALLDNHVRAARGATAPGRAHALDIGALIAEAQRSGMTRLSLETESWDYFEPARTLYRRHGFRECPPFAEYEPDPNSTFMTLELSPHVRSGAGG
jgi:putative acetyltransferase